MSVLTVADLKAHSSIYSDDDDAILATFIDAAEEWVGGHIGKSLASYATDNPPAAVPERAKQAARMLAAHYYENREAALIGSGASEVPFGVVELLRPLRSWGAS
jgi:uncharacterized phage protein (predicted DNA packaging)